MKIYESILALKGAVIEKDGKIVSITLDEKGKGELLKEVNGVESSIFDGSMLFGIVINVAKDCPACGQNIAEEQDNGD